MGLAEQRPTVFDCHENGPDGDEQARRRAWEVFAHGMMSRTDTTGSYQIIEQGGGDGLLFVLRQFARRNATSSLGDIPACLTCCAKVKGTRWRVNWEEYCRMRTPSWRRFLQWSECFSKYVKERPLPPACSADIATLRACMDGRRFRVQNLFISS